MSGGGIGQLCNVIPSDSKHEEVIILAGTNEITRSDSLTEFVYTIEKTVEKLRALAADNQVTMVLPVTPVVTATEIGKAEYLEEKISEIQEIKTVKLDSTLIEFDGVHPTRKGTEVMIRQINDAFDKEIVLPEATSEDITTSTRYSKVQGIFKVGCRACNNMEFCAHLCNACKTASQVTNVEALVQKIKVLDEMQFPAFVSDNNNTNDNNINNDNNTNNNNNTDNINNEGNIDMKDQSEMFKRKRDDVESTSEDESV